MNRTEYKRLAAYYGLVESMRKQIEALEGLIRAINTRSKEQNNAGYLQVSIACHKGKRPSGSYDQGWWGQIPVYQIREAVLPVLHSALRDLKQEYKNLPKMRTDEKVLTK